MHPVGVPLRSSSAREGECVGLRFAVMPAQLGTDPSLTADGQGQPGTRTVPNPLSWLASPAGTRPVSAPVLRAVWPHRTRSVPTWPPAPACRPTLTAFVDK